MQLELPFHGQHSNDDTQNLGFASFLKNLGVKAVCFKLSEGGLFQTGFKLVSKKFDCTRNNSVCDNVLII